MAELAEVVTGLESFLTSMRAAADELVDVAEATLTARPQPRRTDLTEVERVVRRRLGEREEVVHGGGVVAAPGVLTDAPWWLEWFAWDAGVVQRLVSDTDPTGAHFFDYTLMPWFAGPRDRPSPAGTVTGPYVDYLCTDDYTITFTQAVRRPDGSFAGVAGVDVRVLAVEDAFLAELRATGRLLVLVNTLGRVVVSTSARMLSGGLVHEVDVPALFSSGDPRLTRLAGCEIGLLDLGPR